MVYLITHSLRLQHIVTSASKHVFGSEQQGIQIAVIEHKLAPLLEERTPSAANHPPPHLAIYYPTFTIKHIAFPY